jgi:hypothetical protein
MNQGALGERADDDEQAATSEQARVPATRRDSILLPTLGYTNLLRTAAGCFLNGGRFEPGETLSSSRLAFVLERAGGLDTFPDEQR